VRPFVRIAIGAIALLAAPFPAFAQRETFVEGLVTFATALSGTYGDEGLRARAALDTMARALAEWDSSLRDNEATVASRLPTASPQRALEMHTTMGALYLERGRLRDALREFQAASRLAPERAALHVFQGLAHEAADERQEAIQAFRRAWELDPGDPVKAYRVARQALQDDRTAEAAQPLATLAAAVRGIVEQGRPPQLQPFLQVSLVQDEASSTPLFAPALYQQGYALIERGAYADALTALRSAAGADPLIAAAQSERMTQGAEALRDGRIADAAGHFAAEIAARPQGSEAHRMMGMTSWAAADYEKSIEHFENAIRLNPADERARLTLAGVFAEAGQPARAEQALVDAVRALPSSALAHWRLGRLHASTGRNQEAIAELETAVALSALAGRTQLYRTIGALYRYESNAAAAVEAFSRLVRVSPNNPAARIELGNALSFQGRQDEAFIEFVAALIANPDEPEAHLAIGQIHLAAARYPDAVLVLERAVALSGDNAEARYALGTALARTGQTDAAARHLSEYQRLQAQAEETRRRQIEVAVLKLEADTRTREGAHERAVAIWQAVVAAQPDVASNHARLAAALVADGRLEAAAEQYEKALGLDAAPQVYRELAALYEKMGRLDESARTRTRLERIQQEALRVGNPPH
jgi:tetratricopeptide (TPR) repeat protein